MANISKSFLAVESSSVFNSSEWKPVPGEKHTLKEIWAEAHPGMFEQIDGDTAPVTATQFENGIGKRITIGFKDGSTIDLKLSGKSDLEEGDMVKVESITGQLLRKLGQNDIIRYDGELAE